ncbi:MAG TPA: histidine--tRNA ligase [Anaerolineaceae bacterium]|nr:histidine--tRNA ligase [Anaerolineaceae bacterium]HPN50303.1 histidine--tRNA ligase [Anaerolineaceae bacterium]
MKPIISTVKGSRDFYPEEMAVRKWLYGRLQEVSETFGYQEYDGPFLEKIDLYAAKSGEELVKEQAFVFPDRGGDLITLRPELTPSLARMVAQKQGELVFPLRWWSFGPFWRYERPQKGRSREFFQWNIDLIGALGPEADAELVAIGATFLKQTGLKSDEVTILVNNRRLMEKALLDIAIPLELHKSVFRLIDRRDKLSPEAWESYALELGLTSEQFMNLVGLLGNTSLWEQSEELRRFFAALEVMGVREYVRYDPQIIRGLDYYTGTVFEARDRDGEFRAILGGGRYDNLVGDVGGSPLTGVGFAMGDVVVSLVLKKYGKVPAFQPSPAPILVTVFDEERLSVSTGFAARLRAAGLRVNCFTDATKLQKQLKFADKMGFRLVAIIGPEEAAQNQVAIKDLVSRTQTIVQQSEAATVIQQILAGG